MPFLIFVDWKGVEYWINKLKGNRVEQKTKKLR